MFTNTSDKTVVAVRFRFDFLSEFGEHLADRYGTDTGTFTPGVEIDHAHNHLGVPVGMWSAINIWPGIAEIRCSVDTVKFWDGSIWSADATSNALGAAVAKPMNQAESTSAPARVSPTDPKWANTQYSCEQVVVAGLYGAKSASERKRIIGQDPQLQSTVHKCNAWRTNGQKKVATAAATDGESSPNDPWIRDSEHTCNELVLGAAVAFNMSENERNALVEKSPQLKERVAKCEKWRSTHPAATGTPLP